MSNFTVLLMCFFLSVIFTPIVKKLAFKIGATDKPNNRKVHDKVMPRLGGFAIFLSFSIGYFILVPLTEQAIILYVGFLIIMITGFLDDLYQLPAKLKLLGQVIAAFVVVIAGNVQLSFINLPFGGELHFGILSIPLSILWIVGITNAINLIDGLDGLAAGVSTIVLVTISGMAFIMGNIYVFSVGIILIGAILGFLVFNFHPAKIFMGDTGALFLGFVIAVISLLGFKNVTVISFIVPVIVLGVPISDTLFAIVRRLVKQVPLSQPDKYHLHHCLLRLGYTHRQTVLIIYGMSSGFGLAAIMLSITSLWGSFLVLAVVVIAMEIIVEKIGLIDREYRPLLNLINNVTVRQK